MHKRDQISVLLSTLAEGHTITAACKRAGVSRMFYDRHYKSDLAFKKQVDEVRRTGLETNNDRVVSAHMKKISDGGWPAIKYYLEHNVTPYKKMADRPEPVPMHPVPETLSDAEAYEQFVLWSALSPEERSWRGIETREQFCKTYGVPSIRLLDIWAQRPDFEQRVATLREDWIILKTGELLGDIYGAARGGDFKSRRLWLEYARHIKEKRDAAGPKPNLISPEDVRYIIGMLPEALQNLNYMRLDSIRGDVARYERERERKEHERAEIEDRAKKDALMEHYRKPDGEIDWGAYSESL